MGLTWDEQAEVDAVENQCRDALAHKAFTRAWDEGATRDASTAAAWAIQIV